MNHSNSKPASSQRVIILISFWFCFSLSSNAQSIFEQIGRLPITAYSAEEYGGNTLTWASIQSEEGLMYFGSTSGLYEYDGVSWRSLFKRNEVYAIRSFTKDDTGRVFYGGQDFGYLEADQNGGTKAVSLLHLIPEDFRSGFLVWEIHFLNGSILLRNQNKQIIRLELAEDWTLKSLKSWETETIYGVSFVVKNEFYVRQVDKGLYKLEKGELNLIPNTETFSTEALSVMLPYAGGSGQSILMGAQTSGFYLFEDGVLTKFPTQIDQLIQDGNRLYCAIKLQENYILGLLGGGIIMMNSKGELLKTTGTEQGLPSNLVTSVYLDQNKGLWATTEDGVARIAIDSPILSYGNDLGINSAVLTIEKNGKDFYLGANSGLLKFDQTKKTFQSVPEINTLQVFDLESDGEDLIVPGRKLQVLRDGNVIELDGPKEAGIFNSAIIPKYNPNLLLVSSTTGLLVYEKGLSQEFPWEYKKEVPGVGPLDIFLSEGNDGTIFTAGAGKFYIISLGDRNFNSSDPNRIKATAYEISSQTFGGLVDGDFYLFTGQETLKYSIKEGQFQPSDDFREVEKDIYDINELKSGMLFYKSIDGKKNILKRNSEGKFVEDEKPNSIAPYLSGFDYLDEDSIMWFGSPKGLIRYDSKKDNQTDKVFYTLIRRIESKTDTLPLIAYGRDQRVPSQEMKENSLRFEFAAPYFEEEKKTKYQTYLEGFEADWVDWNDNRFKEYTNLSSGTYTFHVRAQALTGRVSEEAVYSFVVLPPWYATWWAYLIYAVLFFGLITAIVKWRSQKLKAENRILEERVNERTAALEKSLNNLKSTQAQLIQSEKMASLGELTAGIAHEIQNPLNFVNNFSEVSNELIIEIKDERAKNQEARDEILISEILGDIEQNLEKIHHHGKRADAIVKGMLQHSRNGTAEKELTNLNTLSAEYLKLSYQSFKNKNKDFKGRTLTEFDSSMPKIEVARQDIGRVILNLINNAFYACAMKDLAGLKPLVTVSTKNLGDKIEISVKDNGPGIPDAIKEKIFQPFFTTKPTGEGTGLGLSLSYDIIKAHGGEIRVESEIGKGTEFTIELPIDRV